MNRDWRHCSIERSLSLSGRSLFTVLNWPADYLILSQYEINKSLLNLNTKQFVLRAWWMKSPNEHIKKLKFNLGLWVSVWRKYVTWKSFEIVKILKSNLWEIKEFNSREMWTYSFLLINQTFDSSLCSKFSSAPVFNSFIVVIPFLLCCFWMKMKMSCVTLSKS